MGRFVCFNTVVVEYQRVPWPSHDICGGMGPLLVNKG